MKLKTYNSENASRRSSGKPTIAFSSKNGVMRINKAGQEKLKIKDGERWSISQDEENVKDWYLHKDAEAGFKVRVSEKDEATFNSSAVCEGVRACVKNIEDDKTCKMYLITEPIITKDKVLLYPILTSSAH
jgi:hypothetical protein